MSILFGNSNRGQSKNLVEFRAGKMNLVGTTVHPDKRKGLIYVHQSDDSLMHFCWKDRGSGVVEDDLIIFPDDIEYKRLAQCTTGRAYLLKFKSSNRRMFFWMQEPKTEKDDEFCKKVNDVLNNPPPLSSSRSGGSTPGGELTALGEGELQSLLNSMGPQQLRQILGSSNLGSLLGERGLGSLGSSSHLSSATATSAPSANASSGASTTVSAPASAPVPASAAPSSNPNSSSITPTGSSASQLGTIQLSQLQNILSGLQVPSTEGNQQQASPHIDLSSGFTNDALQPIINNPEFISRLQTMLPQTGENAPTVEQIQTTLQSPQFHQALSSFSAAMQSGQLAPLMQQFGLGQDVVGMAAHGDMESFVRSLQTALQEQAAGKKDEGQGRKDKHEDDDDEMALD